MAIPKERCQTTNKLRWPNEREARDELRHALRDERVGTKGNGQVRERRVVHCADCDGYHLTSWTRRRYSGAYCR